MSETVNENATRIPQVVTLMLERFGDRVESVSVDLHVGDLMMTYRINLRDAPACEVDKTILDAKEDIHQGARRTGHRFKL